MNKMSHHRRKRMDRTAIRWKCGSTKETESEEGNVTQLYGDWSGLPLNQPDCSPFLQPHCFYKYMYKCMYVTHSKITMANFC